MCTSNLFKKLTTFFSTLTLITLISCNTNTLSTILISKDYKGRIDKWLTNIDPNVKTRVFYDIPTDSMNYFLSIAEGFVIGGGEDVNPNEYGKPEYLPVCGTIDYFRDSIELLMINYALDKKLALLGVCRGHQIINVAMGGTLIPDIPSYYDSTSNHRSKEEYAHWVNISKESMLYSITQKDSFMVNSRHHQAVDQLAAQLSIGAQAPDGIIESIEYSGKDHPFILGVQWHPESLLDSVSNKIGYAFLEAVEKKK